ncbi:IS200/IS605 family transposase [Haloquadratum walsbyi]|uniref:IS200/IS605 family transposase n=1 Tax=Haloquadratum walsbyi TaxID=293091 RepID=UPI003CCC3373
MNHPNRLFVRACSPELVESLKLCILTNLDDKDDCVHILFRAEPTTDLVKFINTVKGATARRIRNEYEDELKTDLWGDSSWNDSYCLISTGQVSLDVLKEYVEDQRA